MLKKGVLIECQHLCSHIGIACVGIWHEDIFGRKESAISFNFILSFFSVSNKNKDYLTMVKKDRIAESRSLIELRTNGITNNPFSIAVYIKKFKSSQFKICYQGYNKTKRRKSPLFALNEWDRKQGWTRKRKKIFIYWKINSTITNRYRVEFALWMMLIALLKIQFNLSSLVHAWKKNWTRNLQFLCKWMH